MSRRLDGSIECDLCGETIAWGDLFHPLRLSEGLGPGLGWRTVARFHVHAEPCADALLPAALRRALGEELLRQGGRAWDPTERRRAPWASA